MQNIHSFIHIHLLTERKYSYSN